jgi:hypothetical protein
VIESEQHPVAGNAVLRLHLRLQIIKGLRQRPVYFTLQKYYEEARVWMSDFICQRHRLPSLMEFGQAAVRRLQ